MNIGLAHYRICNTDGVSLEMKKWYECLTNDGHRCMYISGSVETETNAFIPGIDFGNEENRRINANCYESFCDYPSEETLKALVFDKAADIERRLNEIVRQRKLDCLIVANILSLGWNMSAAIAFSRFARSHPKIRIVSVDSDIYWEREGYLHPVVGFVRDVFDTYLLPDLVNVRHCAISERARNEIIKRRGIYADVLYKAMDREHAPAEDKHITEYLRNRISAGPDDIVVLNPNRIALRKSVEFTVEFVHEMMRQLGDMRGRPLYDGRTVTGDSHVILAMYGLNDSFDRSYVRALREMIDRYGVRFVYMGDIIGTHRSSDLSQLHYLDAYYMADAVAAGSVLEGWGNHLLEAAVTRKPLAMFEYPVYETDLRHYGFRICSMGNQYRDVRPLKIIPRGAVSSAARRMWALLTDRAAYEAAVDKNFAILEKQFSYKRLSAALNKILRF